ncbi:hypothetical protein Bhyg_03305 [Pseudolycoriella hygida]|uniref:Centromere protein C n=1 Tax=Pseudolycoriella hygida TaxID=35572 RepID=A0A9Q0S998_9DIPT|nr:hypothetical protein Bhyg_03305 [Pseudolycoriella hygida]
MSNKRWQDLMKELGPSNQKEDSLELGDSWKDMPRRKKGASNKTTGLFRKTLLPNVNLYDIVINKHPKLTADYQNQNPSSEEEVQNQNEGIANLHSANIGSSSDDEGSEFSKYLCERNKGLTAATSTPYVLRQINPIHRPKIDTDQFQKKRNEDLPTENLLRTVSRIPINTPRSSRVRRDTAEGCYSEKRDISTISSQVVSSSVHNFDEAHHEPETAEEPPEELAAGLLGQNNSPTTETSNKENGVAVRLPDKAVFRVPQRRARSTRRQTIFPESVTVSDQPTTSGPNFSRKNKSTKKNDVLFDSYKKLGEVIANRTSGVISDSSTSSSTRRKLYQKGDSCNEDQISVVGSEFLRTLQETCKLQRKEIAPTLNYDKKQQNSENRLLCDNAGQDTHEFSETAERKSLNKNSTECGEVVSERKNAGQLNSTSTRRLSHHEIASEWSDSEDEQTICAGEASTFRQAPSKNEIVKNVDISPVKNGRSRQDDKENTKDESKRGKMLKNSTFAKVHSHSNNEESSISETVEKTKNSYTETVHLSGVKSGEHLTKMMTPNKKNIGRFSDGNSKQPPSESVDGIISDDRQNSCEIEPIEEENLNKNVERPRKRNLKRAISRNPSNEVISDDRQNSHKIEPIEEEPLKKNVGRTRKQNAKQSISRSSSNEVISDDRQNSHEIEPMEEEPLKKNVGRHSKQHAKQSISRNPSNEVISDNRQNSHEIEPIEEEPLQKNVGRPSKQNAKQSISRSSHEIEPMEEEPLKKNVGRTRKQNAKQSISKSSLNEVISDDRQNSREVEPIEEEPLMKNVGCHSKQNVKQSISRSSSNELISDDRQNSLEIEPIEEEPPKKNDGRHSKQHAKQSISRNPSNEVISDNRQNSHEIEPIVEEPLQKNVGRPSKQNVKQSISRSSSNEVISDDRQNSHEIEPIEEEPLKNNVERPRKRNLKQAISRNPSNQLISDNRQNSHEIEPIEEEPLKKNVGRPSKQNAKQSISRSPSNEVISDDRQNSHGIEPIEEETLKKNVGRTRKQNSKQSISRNPSNEVISDDRQNSHEIEPIEPLNNNVRRPREPNSKQSISRNPYNEIISDDPHSSDKIERIIEEPLKKKVGRPRKQNHKQSTMEEGQEQPQEDKSRSLTNNIENPYKRRNEYDADSEKVSKKKRLNAEITRNDEASKSNGTVAKRRVAKWHRAKIVTYDPSRGYEDVKGTRRSTRKRCIPEQELSYLFAPKSTNQSASQSTRLKVQKTRKKVGSRNQTNTNDDTVCSMLLSNKKDGEIPLLTIFQGIEITQGFHTNVLEDMVIHYVPGSASPSYGYLTLKPGSSKRSSRINYELHFHVIKGPIIIISQAASEIMPTGSTAYLCSGM